jgi:hypothetical protein
MNMKFKKFITYNFLKMLKRFWAWIMLDIILHQDRDKGKPQDMEKALQPKY